MKSGLEGRNNASRGVADSPIPEAASQWSPAWKTGTMSPMPGITGMATT